MKLQVTVTRDDIRKGVPESTCNCPIARAVKRQYKTKTISVGTVVEMEDNFTLQMPTTAHRFITRFDSGQPVKPFSFSLSL